MDGVDVLVLHGSPGSGKTTLSLTISEMLRTADVAHAVIDLDQLSLIFPSPRRSFANDNLRAVWPNFAAVPGLKVVIPTVVADEDELVQLREAVPGAGFTVCELTAPVDVLRERITAREPDEFWRSRLRDFVELFHSRADLPGIRDFQVSTHDRSPEDTAREILETMRWTA